MSAPGAAAPRIAVLGGGIAGLAAAYEIARLSTLAGRRVETVLLEGSERFGGKVLTERLGELTVEAGPDSFITSKPHALALIEELGLSGELLSSAPGPSVFVYTRGRLRLFPQGASLATPGTPWSFLRSDLLTWKGKLRLAAAPFLPVEPEGGDESVAAFIRRLWGAEAADVFAGPILAGIYAADPEQMSLESTFPQLRALARRGAPTGAPARLPEGRTLFMTLKGGLSLLTEALAARVRPAARASCPVRGLERRGRGWRVHTRDGVVEACAVVAAVPSSALADMVGDRDLELASILREIPFASSATVSLEFSAEDFARPPEGFGFVVPRAEGKTIAAVSYSSTKFPGRAPRGTALLRCFIGGAGREAALAPDDAALVAAVCAELRVLLRLKAQAPRAAKVHRWRDANPQYNVGHALKLQRIDSCLKGHPGLFLAGCSYRGIGLSDCILSGRRAAAEALEFTTGRRAPAEAVRA